MEILIDSRQKEKCRNDFKNFLYVVFKHINLPNPTTIQYDIADQLQYADNDLVIEGFRGIAKSTITGIFADWQLDRDPENCQILNVSANQNEASKFMKFTRNLIEVVPFLNYLRPDISKGQRDSALQFDVAPAITRIQPSCKSLGIFGALTGNRATIIIADDIETAENSLTQIKRDLLKNAVTEFRQILIPNQGRLLFLGTPHTETSIYNDLYKKGYTVRIFPIKYPTKVQVEKYADKLAPTIRDKVNKDVELIGKPTDPLRFNTKEILKLEAEGRSKFAMQQMLDTTLSDLERYPLRCSDLIIMDLDKEIAPEKVAYGSSPNLIVKDLECTGIGDDKFYYPIPIPDIKWLPYSYKVMSIDPSGQGQDELAYSILGVVNGSIFLLKQGGLQGGYCEDNLALLASLAKEYKVNKIVIESNFGQGMFSTLLSPYLVKTYNCPVEEVTQHTQKEKRIIDTLEPIFNQHKLVVSKTVVEEDYESIKMYPPDKAQLYSLIHQLTRITKTKGCLNHDDRLDSLSIAVADCLSFLTVNADDEIKARQEEEFEQEIERIYGFSDRVTPNWLTN